MLKRKSQILVSVCLLMLFNICSPCSCIDLSAKELFKDAKVVFLGEALGKTRQSEEEFELGGTERFKVLKIWKGNFWKRTFEVENPFTSCYQHFVKGEKYLVFCFLADGRLKTSECSSFLLSDKTSKAARYTEQLNLLMKYE